KSLKKKSPEDPMKLSINPTTKNIPGKKSPMVLVLLCLFFCGCASTPVSYDPLDQALASNDPRIRQVMDDPQPYDLQIRFTRIFREKDSVRFKDYDFQVDRNKYFYPASTVKFPIAVMALEKINAADKLSINTSFYVEGDTLETTFGQEVIKIFAVSDNDANNRLLEFLGQDAINNSFKSKNIGPARISHRLSVPDADEVTTRPLIVYLNDSTTASLAGSTNTPAAPLPLEGITKGSGYYENDSLIHDPFNFSLKNYYPIETQHGVLKRIIFPETFPENERFNLSSSQREFLLNAMKILPKEAGYNPVDYYDSYGKFLLFGDSKEEIPASIKIYNKVGYAYGTLTDCAYVHDEKNKIEFMVTATILVNSDGIFNDNNYEYDEIGIPFLDALGDELYKIEKNRKK
ncbi:MAG: serine hydrolase, partial [Muriicola sp.]